MKYIIGFLILNLLIRILLTFNRQKEKLEKVINATGYQEKVPSHIQEENAAKLTKLLQECEFFENESLRLEAEMGQ